MDKGYEGMERKSFPFILEEKGVDMEERTFKGYFAVFGNFDGSDVIDKGACIKTIKEGGDRVRVFWIHDYKNPIGKPIEIKEIPRGRLPAELLKRAPEATGGLYVHGYIDPIPEGERALIQMKSGTLGDGSIGFKRIKQYFKEMEDGSRRCHIKELMLYDVSPVPIGMNPGAMITDVKSWEQKVEDSDEFVTVPAPGQEGKHTGDGHRIRFIDIDEKKGIRAKFCGICKKISSYVFTKKKTWTVAKAIAWVKEHHKKTVEFVDDFIAKEQREIEKAIIFAKMQEVESQGELIG